MQAIASSTERRVHVRVAGDGGDIYLDLCDPSWHAVRVTPAGWSVVQSPPARFRREPGMLPLPFPVRGTSIDALRPFLNVRESDFVLVVAFVLAAMWPRGPYPILVAVGEQGSAKTSLLRRLRSLVDPSSVPTSSLTSGRRDLFVSTRNAHMLAFENVSRLADALSDDLCRLATGGGWRTKAVFKDTQEVLFVGARPIALDGISDFVVRIFCPAPSFYRSNRRPTAGQTTNSMRPLRRQHPASLARSSTCWRAACARSRKPV